jgi:hypothetical protein
MDGVELVSLAHNRVERLARQRVANADDIRASSATRQPHELGFDDVVRSLQYRIEAATPELHPFVICRAGDVVGDLNLTQVIRGAEESANVGLLVDRELRGQGDRHRRDRARPAASPSTSSRCWRDHLLLQKLAPGR